MPCNKLWTTSVSDFNCSLVILSKSTFLCVDDGVVIKNWRYQICLFISDVISVVAAVQLF